MAGQDAAVAGEGTEGWVMSAIHGSELVRCLTYVPAGGRGASEQNWLRNFTGEAETPDVARHDAAGRHKT